MLFDILTIFPNLLESPLEEGIVRRAIDSGKAAVNIHNIRDYALDKHSMTDDRPFGGGEGMVMKPEPIAAAIKDVIKKSPGGHVVLLTPQGRTYNQTIAKRLSDYDHLVLLCGRYEGVDERIHRHYVDEEISIGDYVLTGGELAAMVLVDSLIRLIPGVLGCAESAACDSFSRGLLKHPQYTRPSEFDSYSVPEILLSGDHGAISEWRFVSAVKNTIKKRPALLRDIKFTEDELKTLARFGVDLALIKKNISQDGK